MALAVGAAVAGVIGAGMYLDGKYALQKDIDAIRNDRRLARLWDEKVKKNHQSLYYSFEEAVAKRPNHECIWSRDGCYTFSECYDRVNQYAHWFLAQGVKPHDYVALYLHNSADFICAWFGLWAIGAAPAMINYNLANKALLHCLKLSDASLLLVDADPTFCQRIDDIRNELKEGKVASRIVVMDPQILAKIRGESVKRPDDVHREKVQGDWPMSMFYTSGTTGLPKGVPFTTVRMFFTFSERNSKSPLKDDDRWYDCMPMYHGTGGISAIKTILQGVTVCIGKKFSTSRFWKECHDSRATWITYVGETARYLLAAPPGPYDRKHSVRCMYGNGLRPDVWFKFRERFGVPEVIEFFNSSEGVFAQAIYCRGDFFAGCVGHQGVISRYMSRNIMIPVRFDETTGQIARDPKTGFAIREPYEKGGEMIVKIPNEKVFAGYHNNPEGTSKKYERNVFQKGDLYYRSGDSLRRDADGRWFFLDRLGDTFRWKGENVSTAEVAEVMGKFPGIVEANVYGVALPAHDGRAGCAAIFIDPSARHSFDFSDLLKYTRSHLPKYAVPMFIRVVQEMTPIHNNKQNKVPLREEGVDPTKVKQCDKILWITEKGKGHTYVDFHPDHWEDLKLGKSQL